MPSSSLVPWPCCPQPRRPWRCAPAPTAPLLRPATASEVCTTCAPPVAGPTGAPDRATPRPPVEEAQASGPAQRGKGEKAAYAATRVAASCASVPGRTSMSRAASASVVCTCSTCSRTARSTAAAVCTRTSGMPPTTMSNSLDPRNPTSDHADRAHLPVSHTRTTCPRAHRAHHRRSEGTWWRWGGGDRAAPFNSRCRQARPEAASKASIRRRKRPAHPSAAPMTGEAPWRGRPIPRPHPRCRRLGHARTQHSLRLSTRARFPDGAARVRRSVAASVAGLPPARSSGWGPTKRQRARTHAHTHTQTHTQRGPLASGPFACGEDARCGSPCRAAQRAHRPGRERRPTAAGRRPRRRRPRRRTRRGQAAPARRRTDLPTGPKDRRRPSQPWHVLADWPGQPTVCERCAGSTPARLMARCPT